MEPQEQLVLLARTALQELLEFLVALVLLAQLE
jgi:hypothetical protein